MNAFTVAFQVPNLLRSLVADAALSSAFVPVFSELLEKGDRKRAWRVASTLFWLLLLGLGAVTALCIVIAPLIIAPFGDPGGDVDLAVGLSTRPLSDRRPARRLRDHRRDPQQLRALHGARADAGLLEPRDHRRSHTRSPARRHDRREALRLRDLDRHRDGDPGAAPDSLAAWPRRSPACRHRLAGPGRRARLRPHAAGDNRPRPHQLQPGREHAVRVAVSRPRSRRRARSTPRFGSTCSRKGCSRSQSRQSSSLACRRLAARRGSRRASGTRSRSASARSPSRSCPASVFTAVLATPITRIIYERGAWGPEATAVDRRCARRVFARPHLQRSDADAEPRLLQPPDALDSDGDRASATSSLNTILAAALYRPRDRGGSRSRPRSRTSPALLRSSFVFRRRIGRIEFGETAAPSSASPIASAALAIVAYPVWYFLDDALGRSLGGQLASLGTALVSGRQPPT